MYPVPVYTVAQSISALPFLSGETITEGIHFAPIELEAEVPKR